MTEQANGSTPQAKAATLSIRRTEATGADPSGKEAIILIESATDQMVQLHFPSVEVMADFVVSAKAALNQMRQNARKIGDDLVTASPVANFSVGHVAGLDGTLLMIDPDTPSEASFVFANEMACDAGKLLVMEGGKRIRIRDAITAGTGTKVMAPARRRILRPGEQ